MPGVEKVPGVEKMPGVGKMHRGGGGDLQVVSLGAVGSGHRRAGVREHVLPVAREAQQHRAEQRPPFVHYPLRRHLQPAGDLAPADRRQWF